jgi:branched-chain amino acid transport system permease protein
VTPGVEDVGKGLSRRGRWGILEILFWLVAAATVFVLPERHLILNEIAIIGLFAISLDLILGYAGIVSLGHAAFFGLGAYGAGPARQERPRRPAPRPSRSRPWRRRSSAS